MNVLAWVLVIGLGLLIVYEVMSLVRSIVAKRRKKKESLKDGDGISDKEEDGR